MTNRLAIALGMLVLAVVVADLFYFEWGLMVFLGRKMLAFIEYLAFWR